MEMENDNGRKMVKVEGSSFTLLLLDKTALFSTK